MGLSALPQTHAQGVIFVPSCLMMQFARFYYSVMVTQRGAKLNGGSLNIYHVCLFFPLFFINYS